LSRPVARASVTGIVVVDELVVVDTSVVVVGGTVDVVVV
jgi:hypothetical protein